MVEYHVLVIYAQITPKRSLLRGPLTFHDLEMLFRLGNITNTHKVLWEHGASLRYTIIDVDKDDPHKMGSIVGHINYNIKALTPGDFIIVHWHKNQWFIYSYITCILHVGTMRIDKDELHNMMIAGELGHD